MADPENIGIAVGIELLASLGAKIYAFHGCRPPSWIFHFQFSPSLVERHRYMCHWYGWPRKHRFIRWNCVAIKFGNGDIRFVVSTSGLWPPSCNFHLRSFEKVFRRARLSLRSLNLIKISLGWYDILVLRSLKVDFLIKWYFLVFNKIHINKNMDPKTSVLYPLHHSAPQLSSQ